MTTDDRARIWSAIRDELPNQLMTMFTLASEPMLVATLDGMARDLADAVVRVMEEADEQSNGG